eukprot:COSAG06_NODE_36536_length_446_cov_0.567723_2_plen_105_part_01
MRKEKKRKQQAAAAAAAAKTPQGKGPATWHGGMVSTAVAGDASPQEHLRQAKRTLNEYREAKEWAWAGFNLQSSEQPSEGVPPLQQQQQQLQQQLQQQQHEQPQQ